jgi:hypothetical protein
MAKHLKPADITAIVDIIRGWPDEKLTWERICDSANQILGSTPTRQTLNAQTSIKQAYVAKKSGLQVHAPRTATPSSLSVAAQRIAHQQSVIDELKSTNAALLEQFVKWQYNAYKYGMKENQLNEPLPRIDRERTET